MRDDIQKYLDFGYEFLLEEYKRNGNNLQCVYCGEQHLEIGSNRIEDSDINNKISNLATIDHIIPLLPNEERLNKDVCVVACKQCNKRKGRIHPDNLKAPEYGNMILDSHKKEYFKGNIIVDKCLNHYLSYSNNKRTIKTSNKASFMPIISLHNLFLINKIDFNIYKLIIEKGYRTFCYTKESKSFYFSFKKKRFNFSDIETSRLSRHWKGYKLDKSSDNEWILGEINSFKSYTYITGCKESNSFENKAKILEKSKTIQPIVLSSKSWSVETYYFEKCNIIDSKFYNRFIGYSIDSKILEYLLSNNITHYRMDNVSKNIYFHTSEFTNKATDKVYRLSSNWEGTNLSLQDDGFHLCQYNAIDKSFAHIMSNDYIDNIENKHNIINLKRKSDYSEKNREYSTMLHNMAEEGNLSVMINNIEYPIIKIGSSRIVYLDNDEKIIIKHKQFKYMIKKKEIILFNNDKEISFSMSYKN